MDMNTGGIRCIQQRVTGTGVFNGTPVGYARLAITNGGATLNARARELGAAGNDNQIQLVDPGRSNPRTYAVVVEEGRVQVFLRHNGAAVVGTAMEVTRALHAIRQTCPIAAAPSADGVMAATAMTALAGGLDADELGGISRYDAPENDDGGLFYFDQYLTQRVHQIEGKFTGPGNVEVALVNVDPGLNVMTDDGPIVLRAGALSAADDFILTDLNLVLMRGQAIRVTGALQGVARIYVQRDDGLG